MKRVRAVVVLSLVYAAVFVVVQGVVNVALHYFVPGQFPALGEFLSWRLGGAPKSAIFGFLIGAQLMFQLSITRKFRRSISMGGLVRNGALGGLFMGLVQASAMRMNDALPHSPLRFAVTVATYVLVATIATAIIAWLGITPRERASTMFEAGHPAAISGRRELVLNEGLPQGRVIRVQLVPKRLWAWFSNARSQ